MECLAGEDLQRLLDRTGPLPPDVALRIAAHALLGLARAHEAGIVHRDIKPANLFLARDGGGAVTVKILDFGIAKIKADVLGAQHLTDLTGTGDILGSPAYLSPEQAQNSKNVDLRTDLWSLGCVLYCALSGQAPHQHLPAIHAIILAICCSPARPLRERAPWVSAEHALVVHRALEIEPDKRYPSAAAMLDAIRPLVPGGLAIHEEMLSGLPPELSAAAGRVEANATTEPQRPITRDGGDPSIRPTSPAFGSSPAARTRSP
jgi:serine/threonine-protein kinase